MFIRSTFKKDTKTNKKYFSYQLVESYRTEKGPRQRIHLTISNAIELSKEERKLLANRIEEKISGITTLLPPPSHIEELAHHFAIQLIDKRAKEEINKKITDDKSSPEYVSVDINSVQHELARSVGIEHICLETARRLGLDKLFLQLGLTERQTHVALGVIVARLAGCGSELETYRWLQNSSAFDELLGTEFSQLSKKIVYESSDLLIRNKDLIEKHLLKCETELFNLDNTIVLYDLTNTYFEGRANGVIKAKKGHSKEKKRGSPLVTLGLSLNSAGFPLKSDIYEGNISEPKTLKEIVNNLNGPSSSKPVVVLDAGIATNENIDWLRASGYAYIVCSKQKKNLPIDLSFETVCERSNNTVKAARIEDSENQETVLVCHSEMKEQSDLDWQKTTQKKFEEELIKLKNGLSLKGRMKGYQKVCEKIGRLKKSYSRIGQYYKIDVQPDDEGVNAVTIDWEVNSDAIEKRFSGNYFLRSYGLDWDDKTLWDTYIMLTRVEHAFRCLKNDIGLRPIFHKIDRRVDGHIFITLLAYHIMQTIQHQLRDKHIHLDWKRIRQEMGSQVRVTTSAKTKEGKLLRIRNTTNPEPFHQQIYSALRLSQRPGKKRITRH